MGGRPTCKDGYRSRRSERRRPEFDSLHDPWTYSYSMRMAVFFFQAEDGIRDWSVTGVQTCALPICAKPKQASRQWAERQKLAPPPAPKELHPARVIDILVDLLHHPEDDARAVCQRLRAGGHPVTPEIGRASCRERV